MSDNSVVGKVDLNLIKLFLMVWSMKIYVIIFSILATFIVKFYFDQNKAESFFNASILIKVSEIKFHNKTDVIYSTDDLKYILEAKGKGLIQDNDYGDLKFFIKIPPKTTNLLRFGFTSSSNSYFEKMSQDMFQVLKQFEKPKLDLYEQVLPTKQIGKLVIKKQTTKDISIYKIFMLCFVGSLVLALLFGLVRQYIVPMFQDELKKKN